MAGEAPQALLAALSDPSVKSFLSDPNNLKTLQSVASKLGSEGMDEDIRERFDGTNNLDQQQVLLLMQGCRWLKRLYEKGG